MTDTPPPSDDPSLPPAPPFALPPPPPPPPPLWAQPPGTWLPPPPPPAPEASPGRRRLLLVGLAIAGILVLAGVLVVTVVLPSGPDHPDEWDPRVADLASFVEKERDLLFRHPVYVDFLSPEDYTAASTVAEDDLLDEDRADLARYAGELRALGVASGELDLFTAFNQVSDSGTLAFYDHRDKRVVVRGTDVTVGIEVTLVHELTHALQDQHFDLKKVFDDDLDAGAASAFRALVEGDAVRIEDAYVEGELDSGQQAAYEEELAEEVTTSEESTADVPPFITASFGVPYALGQPFVLMLLNQGGNDAIDDALREPPTTGEHLFDPLSYLAGDDQETVNLGLAEDVELFDEGPFGAASWYLVLAERIDPLVAFDAVIGWNGDAFAAFQRDGTTCVRVGFAGDTATDEDELADALDLWLDAMPGGAAERLDLDGRPGLEACDPGEEADLALTGRSEDSLFVPALWGYLIADSSSVLDVDKSRCYARRVLDGLTYEQMTDEEGAAFEEEDFQQSLFQAFDACR